MRHSHSLIAAALITLSSATVARAFDVDAERPAMRAALEAAERGPFDLATQTRLRKHPLWPWLEATALGRDLASTSNAQAQDFLQRFDGQPAAENFRDRWLGELARRNDWTGFMVSWKPRNDTALRCQQLRAREALGQANAQWDNDAQAIWRNGKSLPDACDPVFASLDARGGLTPALRWERIGLAIEDAQPGVIRAIARGLPPTEAAQATAYAAFLDAPGANVTGWPRDARSRRVATVGLAQLARRDPGAAENALPAVTAALQLDDAARNQVLAEIAVWSAANSLPEAPRRFAAIPATAYDERLHEWRAREAMMRADWPAALTAIRAMASAQRSDPRWRWFEARLAEKTGDSAGARALYAQVATSPTFHGFLAADKLGQSYALCPVAPHDSAQAKHQVARDPGIVRATELWKLQRKAWANQEWNAALARFNADQRRIAVEVAQDNEWFDRAVFALREADELRLYKLRFPIHHKRRINHEAEKRGIDPAWVAAEIRAESLFDPTARSSADARGLMQVLPSTGAAVARRIGLDWKGGDTLYDPDDNIAIGTAYLRETLDRHGQTYLAIAAYNAGAAPVNRWLAARPDFDPDFWIETIGYKETREYVARVLAFSVIYDWRMEGDALPVSERLRGNFGGKRKGFACPAP